MDQQEHNGKYQQKMNSTSDDVERQPADEPYAHQKEKQRKENEICEYSHKFEADDSRRARLWPPPSWMNL